MQLDEMLKRTVQCVKSAVEDDVIVGKPILAADGSAILPISKLSYGFVSGGGEYGKLENDRLPYAGICGGGATVIPLGFLICGREKKFVRLDDASDGKAFELLKSIINVFKKDK